MHSERNLPWGGSAAAMPWTWRGWTAAATVAVLAPAALDMPCNRMPSARAGSSPARAVEDHAMEVKQAITINRPADEIYRFWHNFEHLPQFMEHLTAVQVTGEKRSHRTAKAPAGTTAEWDAEIVEDRPNELIAWRSLQGSSVDNEGSVRFAPAPGGRGTEVRVALRETFMACRNGGTVSVPGVYGGLLDKMPFGAVMNRSLTIKTGRRMCSATCARCWNASRRARSTRAS